MEISFPKPSTLILNSSDNGTSIKAAYFKIASTGQTIPICPETSINSSAQFLLVGRQAATADIRIDHGSISRKHAALYFLPSSYYYDDDKKDSDKMQLMLQDLGGKHGCFINGKRIPKKDSRELVHGDEVRFGSCREQVFRVFFETDFDAQSEDNLRKEEELEETRDESLTREENEVTKSLTTESQATATTTEAKEPLTGRAKREAEIAAMMASLEQPPTYTPMKETITYNVANSTTDGSSTNDDKTHQTAVKYKLPVTSTLLLPNPNEKNQHHHPLTALSLDPSGSRLLTGSTDTNLRLYDLNSLSSSKLPFKTIRVEDEGTHPLTASSFSISSGDRIMVGTTSAQPSLLDRDGRLMLQFIKGDPYVTDMARTLGHTSSVTDVSWHPLDKDVVLTTSTDGSARTWDVSGRAKTQFSKLCCGNVYRVKDEMGRRVVSGGSGGGVTCGVFAPGGQRFCLGTACGSLQVWRWWKGRVGTRPEWALFGAHDDYNDEEDERKKKRQALHHLPLSRKQSIRGVHSMVYNVDGTRLASRSIDDDTVRVWDMNTTSKTSSLKSKRPLAICIGLKNRYEYSNCAFSPDGRFLCAGTSVDPPPSSSRQEHGVDNGRSSDSKECGMLKFYRIPTGRRNGDDNDEHSATTRVVEPLLEMKIAVGISVVKVEWHAKLNQIFLGLSDGSVRIMYDDTLSRKGALLSTSSERMGRVANGEDELSKLLRSRLPPGSAAITGEIMAPHALPLFREGADAGRPTTKRKREKDRADPIKSRRPEPPSSGIKMGEGTSASLNFTQFIVTSTSMTKNRNIAGKDPREELFKYSKGKKYLGDEGDGVLAEKTAEEEEEEMMKGQK